MEQRCGNCKWFEDRGGISGFDPGEGICKWLEARMPSAYINHHNIAQIRPHTFKEQGMDCPTYEATP